MVPGALDSLSWEWVIYAALSLTVAPAARRCAARTESMSRTDERMAEHEPVTEMPLRIPFRHERPGRVDAAS
jgi:hypothetical protein